MSGREQPQNHKSAGVGRKMGGGVRKFIHHLSQKLEAEWDVGIAPSVEKSIGRSRRKGIIGLQPQKHLNFPFSRSLSVFDGFLVSVSL